MTIKVVYDYQIFSEQTYGGVSRYIFEVASQISASEKFDVSILSPLYINKYLEKYSGSMVVGRYMPKIACTGRLRLQINKYLSKRYLEKHPPRLIHETYYSNEPNKKVPDASYVITVHDMIHERFPEFFHCAELTTKRKKISIEKADHVICVSESTRNDLLSYFNIDEKNVSVIHHGYSKITVNSIFTIPIIERPYLLFIGQRDGYKNFLRLLSAFSKFNLNKDFVLICVGGGEFTKCETEEILRLRLNNKEVIRISASDSELKNLYANAAAFVYPSIYEGFGIPLLEAMAYQCPVVCSKTNSFVEVAGYAAEYFDPFNVDSIGTTLSEVVYSQDKISTLIKAGKERIKNYSWEKCSRETMSVYEKIV